MDVNVMRVAVTVLSFLSFTGIWWWAWRSSNRSRFDELARVCVGLDERDDEQRTSPGLPVHSEQGLPETRLLLSAKEGA